MAEVPAELFPVGAQGIIMGHELAGEIIEAAPGVDRARVGEKVAVVPFNFCGSCQYCRDGRISICQAATNVIGLGANPGGFAEYLAVPEQMAVPLGDGLGTQSGALAEPLAVAHHGVDLAGINPGQSALVVGCGPIGALTVLVLKASGVECVIVSEPNSFRRTLAGRLGSPVIVDPASQDLGTMVRDEVGALGVDFVFECSGLPGPFASALECLKPGGTLVQLGVGMEPVPLIPVTLVVREHVIKGALGYSDYFESAIRLLHEGLDIEPVTSEVRGLAEVGQAFADLSGGADLCKVLISPAA